jgi:hypothetical protein
MGHDGSRGPSGHVRTLAVSHAMRNLDSSSASVWHPTPSAISSLNSPNSDSTAAMSARIKTSSPPLSTLLPRWPGSSRDPPKGKHPMQDPQSESMKPRDRLGPSVSRFWDAHPHCHAPPGAGTQNRQRGGFSELCARAAGPATAHERTQQNAHQSAAALALRTMAQTKPPNPPTAVPQGAAYDAREMRGLQRPSSSFRLNLTGATFAAKVFSRGAQSDPLDSAAASRRGPRVQE